MIVAEVSFVILVSSLSKLLAESGAEQYPDCQSVLRERAARVLVAMVPIDEDMTTCR
jgi:hypothetical protein